MQKDADTAIRGVGFGREIRPQGVSIAREFTVLAVANVPLAREPMDAGWDAEQDRDAPPSLDHVFHRAA
jgi:hypothetical protein